MAEIIESSQHQPTESEQLIDAERFAINRPIGHEEGSQYYWVNPNAGTYVSNMKFYTHNGPGDHEILKSIELTWNDGQKETIGKPSGEAYEVIIAPEEKITNMYIRTGDWVDGISYTSTRLIFETHVGGPGGAKEWQNTGSGLLAGFHGQHGADVDKLGAIFWR